MWSKSQRDHYDRVCDERSYGDDPDAVHIVKRYATGVGHIERLCSGNYHLSFYGRRVQQNVCATLQSARYTLRRMATNA